MISEHRICSWTATIRSENGSNMARENRSGVSSDEINYRVRIAPVMGSPISRKNIDVSNPNQLVEMTTCSVPSLCGHNSRAVLFVKVYVTIGEVENKISGVYPIC